MRVVFFGTPELACPSLEAAAARHEVTAVVCQPDKPQGRSGTPTPPAVKVWAQAHGIEVVQPERLNDGTFEAWLRAQRPDVCAIAAYGRLLKQPILDVPAHGFINMHPSLLPRHRGPSPITTALLEGDTETGVSIMRLTLEVDAGDLLLQERTPIAPEEDNIALTARLSALGGRMLADALDLIAEGRAVYTPQDSAKATYSHMFRKADGQIAWNASARRIHNLVRAAVPWPVAHCLYKGQVFRVLAARVVDEPADAAPGTVVRVAADGLCVATGEGLLALTRVQAPGKRPMDVSDFLRGHRIAIGERFEELPPA